MVYKEHYDLPQHPNLLYTFTSDKPAIYQSVHFFMTLQDLVVRLLFTLGNLAARSNEARQRVYEEDGALDALLDLFQIYMQGVRDPLESQEHSSSEEDVQIKLIRVLANLSIHPTVGVVLAANSKCVDLLLGVMGKSV